ncbi:MAG: glycosyltransferase, partial [Oligoflexia bacterium]|nr:glycosyltransferase [Oligoflexia bacterium]
VVDDGSPDGTANVARDHGALVLERPSKAGLASAYVLGLGHALDLGCDPIVQMDADLSHDPADLPRLLASLGPRPLADLVIGSRYVSGGGTCNWSLSRRLLSRLGCRYAQAWLGLPVQDLTGGFKAWSGAALRAVDLPTVESRGYAFQCETTARAVAKGMLVVEIPITFTERRTGASKMSRDIAIEAALVVPRLGRGLRPGPRRSR